jgi:hypothetical protein
MQREVINQEIHRLADRKSKTEQDYMLKFQSVIDETGFRQISVSYQHEAC